ncbi:hypothetical protein L195_g025676 [Trifolium pratense]|uniref:Uncharacterized protein n=1 Tax=Trifolium pratense TaxID=57577 RepID=A0A2K3NH74_TRIPR|nr:hypothetical protein L195_g025676 [Trifolium pratense]
MQPETQMIQEMARTETTEMEGDDGIYQISLPATIDAAETIRMRTNEEGDLTVIETDPFTLRILESRIPRTLEKLPKMESYDGIADSDEHLEARAH